MSAQPASGRARAAARAAVCESNEDDISHSIFYTAITEAREHSKLFWTPETQLAVVSSLARKIPVKDIELLKARRGVAPIGIPQRRRA